MLKLGYFYVWFSVLVGLLAASPILLFGATKIFRASWPVDPTTSTSPVVGDYLNESPP